MSIEVLPDEEALALRVADLFALVAQEAAAARGRFAVALGGGETPRRFFGLLARQQFSQKIPWRRTHLYWGDERCVPAADPASNFGMARDTFVKHVPVPTANLRRVHGEEQPERAAALYGGELQALAALERPKSELPVFDLVLLGLGLDGHTASLFPHSPALDESERLAVATHGSRRFAARDRHLPRHQCRPSCVVRGQRRQEGRHGGRGHRGSSCAQGGARAGRLTGARQAPLAARRGGRGGAQPRTSALGAGRRRTPRPQIYSATITQPAVACTGYDSATAPVNWTSTRLPASEVALGTSMASTLPELRRYQAVSPVTLTCALS